MERIKNYLHIKIKEIHVNISEEEKKRRLRRV